MRAWRSSAPLQLAAVASVSVLVGHWLAYLVAVPHAGLRDDLLLTSGHGYWLLAVKAALVLGTAALAAAGIDALRHRTAAGSEGRSWSAKPALVCLVVVQLCSFTLLEAGERILAGEPWLQMLHHDVYAWGVLAQLLIAPLGAGLLKLLARAVHRVAQLPIRRSLSAPRGFVLALPTLPDYVPPRDWRGTFATRGPPA